MLVRQHHKLNSNQFITNNWTLSNHSLETVIRPTKIGGKFLNIFFGLENHRIKGVTHLLTP